MKIICGSFYQCDSVTEYCDSNEECQDCKQLCDLKDKTQCQLKCKDFMSTVASTTTKTHIISQKPDRISTEAPEEPSPISRQHLDIRNLIRHQEILTGATLASVALLLILWFGYTIYRSRKHKKSSLKLSNLNVRHTRNDAGHVYEAVPLQNNTWARLNYHHQMSGHRSSSDSNLPLDPRTSLCTTNGTCGSCSRMPQQATDYTGLNSSLAALRVDGSSVPDQPASGALRNGSMDSSGYHFPRLIGAVPRSDSGNGTSPSSSSTPVILYPPHNARCLISPLADSKDNTLPKTVLKQGHSDPQHVNEYKVTVS